jgi:hypothetical protein
MQRFLFRVQYTRAADPDDAFDHGDVQYEPICIRGETAAAALAEADAATERYPLAVGMTKTITLTLTTADV